MRYITLVLVMISLIGCAQYRHHENVVVEQGQFTLERIEGTYKNSGLYPNGYDGKYLSEILFPSEKQHEAIEHIRVQVDSKQVTCSGLRNGVEIVSAEYIEGEDFKFEGNAISLGTETSCFGCASTGAMHMGIALKNQSLYLSKDGDAILRSNETGTAAILILPIPLALIEETDILFKRVISSR